MTGPFYFAFAGGPVQEQVIVVTTGNTHGSEINTIGIVGDVTGTSLLINLASQQGLEAGAFYQLAGPGIEAGTYFLFDDSILSGPPGSIALSRPATTIASSQTFEATRASIIGTVAGALTQGSNVITLPGVDLAPGSYGVAGIGIGETDVPVGVIRGSSTVQQLPTSGGITPPIMVIGSALMRWDGSEGTLFILAATSTTTVGVLNGQQTNVVTWSVAEQDVRATTGGTFPVQITGFPEAVDPRLITDIPLGVVASLEPGLVYNVAGNGIPIGATITAPPLGEAGTTVELDVQAEGSAIGGVITITGPRTPNEPFDPATHARNDADLLSLELDQEEGNFATLTVTMRNPGIGLLALGRQLWCWLSWDQAWTPDGSTAPDIVPLFNGRLVGVPQRQANEVVQLQFFARPDDYNAQKLALADSMKVLPFYDPVWLASPNVTPDTVLEAYSALWHIDPVTLSVTASDILEGEDGIVTITEDQALYDDFNLSYGPPPLVAVTVSGTVQWQQQADGFIDVTKQIVQAFKDAGSPYGTTSLAGGSFNLWAGSALAGVGSTSSTGGLISCLCGDGLKNDWPKPGINIGGGWNLATLNDSNGIPLCYIIDATTTGGGWLQQQYYNVTYAGGDQTYTSGGGPANTTGVSSNVGVYLQPYGQWSAAFPLNVYKVRMTLQYRANRKRTETVSAVLTADVQRILSDSSDQDREGVSVTSQYVDEGIDLDGGIPIGNLAYRSFFQTDRGARAFEHLLLLARAKMRHRARAVDIDFRVDWRTAVPITLRQSVAYHDRRVPGGIAVGKVRRKTLHVADGKMVGHFRIGCAVGNGNVLSFAPTINSYVDDGYVSSGYQDVTGTIPLNDDIGYQPLTDFSIIDDGLDLANLTADAAVNECIVINGLSRQVSTLSMIQGSVQSTPNSPQQAMTSIQTAVTLDMKPLTGSEFHTDFLPDVAPLALPKLIDLSAVAQ